MAHVLCPSFYLVYCILSTERDVIAMTFVVNDYIHFASRFVVIR